MGHRIIRWIELHHLPIGGLGTRRDVHVATDGLPVPSSSEMSGRVATFDRVLNALPALPRRAPHRLKQRMNFAVSGWGRRGKSSTSARSTAFGFIPSRRRAPIALARFSRTGAELGASSTARRNASTLPSKIPGAAAGIAEIVPALPVVRVRPRLPARRPGSMPSNSPQFCARNPRNLSRLPLLSDRASQLVSSVERFAILSGTRQRGGQVDRNLLIRRPRRMGDLANGRCWPRSGRTGSGACRAWH